MLAVSFLSIFLDIEKWLNLFMSYNAPTTKYNQSAFSDDLAITILLSCVKEFDLKFTLGMNHYNQVMT